MRLKEGFITHETQGNQIMIATGTASFSGFVRSNPTAAMIVNCLKEETTVEKIVQALCDRYDADPVVVEKDVEGILAKLRGIGAITE